MGATAYIIEQGETRRTPAGYVEEFSIQVDGVSGSSAARRGNALREADKLIPYGSAHPSLPGIFLLDQRARELPGSNTKFRIDCTYRAPTESEQGDATGAGAFGPTSVSIDASTVFETIYRDIHGQLMETGYRGRVTIRSYSGIDGSFYHKTTENDASIARHFSPSIEQPRLIATLSRWERANPINVAARYVGRINSEQWGRYPPKTWLCTAIRSTPRTDGLYDVDYVVQYKPDTWVFEGVLTINNQIPRDIREGNGLKTFDVYPSANFTALGLAL